MTPKTNNEWDKLKKYLLAVHKEYSERNGRDYCKNCGVSMQELVEKINIILSSERQKAFEECPGIPGTPCKCETNYCQIWGIKQEKIEKDWNRCGGKFILKELEDYPFLSKALERAKNNKQENYE